jgi:hypothetical protein
MYTEQKSYEPLLVDAEEPERAIQPLCSCFADSQGNISRRWKYFPGVTAFFFFAAVVTVAIITGAFDDEAFTSIIFIFRDAGEWYSLYPLLLTLQDSNKHIIVSGWIVNGGTAPAVSATKENKNVGMLTSFFPTLNVKKMMERNATFDQADEFAIKILKQQHQEQQLNYGKNKIKKYISISGLVSQAQIDITKAFKTHINGIETIGYNDGFNNWGNSTWANKAMVTAQSSQHEKTIFDKLWVNAKSIKEEAVKSLFAQTKLTTMLKTEIVGDSSFLSWETETKKDTLYYKNVRKYMFGESEKDCFGILYFGGYGDLYYESVQLFANVAGSMTNISKHTTHDSSDNFFCFAFVAHPGIHFNAKKEEEIFKNAGADVKILNRSMYATSVYTKGSNATLSQGSSCGPQSISIGVPSLFTQTSNNIFQTAGLIPVAHDFTTLKKWFYKMKATHSKLPDGTHNNNTRNNGAEILKRLGIPLHPMKRCMEYLFM